MNTTRKNIIIGIVSSIAIAAFLYFGDLETITNVASSSIVKADSTDIADMNFTSSRENLAAKKTGAFGEYTNTTATDVEAVPEYIRKPKKLAEDFTGYKIEVLTVYNQELSLNDELHKQFGGIMIHQRTSNSYTYLVGDFDDQDACEEYLGRMIQERYPKAKGVRYENGTIVKYK